MLELATRKVTFHEVANYFDPRERKTYSVEWYEGCTVSAHMPDADPGVQFAVIVNGRRLLEDEYAERLKFGDDVTFIPVPEGAGAAVATFFTLAEGTAAFAAVAFVVNTAILVGINYALAALTGTPKFQTRKEDRESETYGFQNLQSNAVHEGGAIQVGYGEHRIAPQIVNVFRRSSITPIQTTVYVMGSLGHGPIESIGQYTTDQDGLVGTSIPAGILIEGQPAENFQGIECWIRMGDENQEAIPGFEDSVSEPSVSKSLAYLSTTTETVGGAYPASDLLEGGAAYWPAAEAYTMTEDADSFGAIVGFPSGLFNINPTTGALLVNDFECQIRYTEVDGGGVPFGDTIVLPKEVDLSVAKKSSFFVEYRHTFIDPATYTPAPLGYFQKVASFGGAAAFGATVAAPSYPSSPINLTEFTVSFWTRIYFDFDGSGVSSATYRMPDVDGNGAYATQQDADNVFFSFFDATSSTGIRLRIRHQEWGGPVGNPYIQTNQLIAGGFEKIPASHIEVDIGSGSDVLTVNHEIRDNPGSLQAIFNPSLGAPSNSPWVMVTVAYRGLNGPDGSDHGGLAIYLNDQPLTYQTKALQRDILPGDRMVLPPAGTDLSFGVPASFSGDKGIADYDQGRIYDRTLDEFEIAQLYNNGKGRAITGNEPDLIMGWEFQTASGSPAMVPDVVDPGGSNDIEIGANSALTTGTEYGVVASQPSGDLKRGMFKIEMQRLNVEDSATNSQDAATWDSVQLVTDERFQRPGKALIALKIPSQGQLNTSLPSISAIAKLRKVPIWDQVSVSTPNAVETWSDSPAWAMVDAATNQVYGMGGYYSLADIDLPKFQEFADRCAELRRDSLGVSAPVRIDYVSGSPDEVQIIAAGGSLPAHIAVGTKVAVENATDPGGSPAAPSWDTDPSAGEFLTVTSIDTTFAPTLEVWHCSWPTGKAVPSPLIAEGQIYGLEPRFTFNGVFDEPLGAWDVLKRIAQTAWAVPVKVGKRLTVFYDDPASPTALVNMGNVVEGSFEVSYSGVTSRPNSLEIEHLSKVFNYERKYVTVDHDTAQDPTTFDQFRKKRYALHGITSTGQIRRHGRRELNLSFLLRKTVKFKVSKDAMHYLPGDVINVAHDVPQWGFSGRLLTDAASDTVVKLDRDIEIDGVSTYELEIRNSINDQLVTRTITTATDTAAGSDVTVSASFGFTPKKGDLYSFGLVAASSKPFRITKTKFDPSTLQHTVEAIEYNADVYEDYFSEVPESVSALPPVVFESSLPGQPSNVVISDGSWRDASGVMVPAIDVSWSNTVGTASAVAGTKVFIARSAGEEPKLVATTNAGQNSVSLTDSVIAFNEEYFIRIVPFNGRGVHLEPTRSPVRSITLSGRSLMPDAPVSLEAVQSGTSALYTLSAPAVGQQARPVSGEIRAGGWIAGQHIATVTAGEQTRPTSAWYSLPTSAGLRSSVPLYARYEYANGQLSDVVRLLDFAPSAPGTVLSEDSFEDGPWDAVTGDSGAVALSELESEAQFSGEEFLRFTDASTSLTGTWTSPEYDTGRNSSKAVFFCIEAAQVHPMTYADANADWDHVRDYSIEGPLVDFPDLPTAWRGQVSVKLEVAFSSTATPGTDWQEYRPGVISARSFAFRISITRPTVEFNVDIWRGAFRITEPELIVTYAGSF